MTHNDLGKAGEDAASNFLKKMGYKIIAKNYQNTLGRRLGEIDIIAKDREEIVFVEVKTRELGKYGDTLPEENITHSKLHKLNKIASCYIRNYSLWNSPYRFDAISVWLDMNNKKAKIKHIRSMFL
jgi:putative endonuclease